jgi:serine/threonine protein kinase
MITFACPTCQKQFSVKDEMGKCPACGQMVVIPSPEERPTLGPAPSRQDALTHPPLHDPDATQGGNKPDSSLTDFLAPPQADDELGRLGKYRVLRILGHGGMGVVYLAEDPKLKRSVAIKAILPTLAASDSAGKRFLREAQAMAAVKHDHIATIYQVDEERGIPFLAMEFLAGQPLDERLKRDGKLPVPEVLRIGREIAEGLEAAHATGLIHRDIKPANVWLEAPRGRVKILDFGLARAVSQDAGLTQQGAIVGTPAFMAPEQGRGEAVDARCDLFSLGVVLYRLCTGQQPFKGKDTVSTLMEVALHQPPPPRQLNAEVPQDLSDLVMKLLEKDAARRPASAGEVVRMLAANGC